MKEEVIALARAACLGADEDEHLLEMLCMAACQRWEARLRSGVKPEDCMAAFCCAAALTAASHLTAKAAENFAAFTAGEITVKARTAGEYRERAEDLRRAAEELMAPYAVPENFSFKGV